jgi:hypothetical protein
LEYITYIRVNGIIVSRTIPSPPEPLINLLTTTLRREALKQGLKRLKASWFCWETAILIQACACICEW